MKRHLLFLFVLFAFLPIPVQAADITEVLTVGPSWDTFTNRDGTGLYHEALREIFDLYGIPVRHEYVPTDRGDELVRLGQADMMTCDDKAQEPLVAGRYPLYTNDYFVFFNKERIGPWKGPESLRDKDVAAQLGYYHDWDFPAPVRLREMRSGVKCLEMVLLGRSDFYVDDMSFINASIRASEVSFDRDAFAIKRIGTRSYRPSFNQSPRGQQIRQLFEEGIMTLHKAGKLKHIYKKWGHDYPDFDSF